MLLLPPSQDRSGALFFVCINQAFGGVFGTCTVFPAEKKIVDRERTAGAYAVLPYYIAKWLAEFPFAAAGPGALAYRSTAPPPPATPHHRSAAVLFACIVYWMIGFVSEATRFFTFVGIIVAINSVAVSAVTYSTHVTYVT